MTVSGSQAQQDWEYAREIKTPFVLRLTSGLVVSCEEILRLLPGRRLVCRARVVTDDSAGELRRDQSDQVLIKLFMGSAQEQEATEDRQGVQAIARANILTPALLRDDRVQDKGYPVLVFEFLEAAQQFKDAWKATDQQPALLKKLLQMVATEHAAGLRQRDFHLKNFLLGQDGSLYAIDGGDYALGPVSKSMVLRNLGMLFGHLPREVLLGTPEWVQVYNDVRGWGRHQLSFTAVLKNADRFRRTRARRIARKAYRNCSEFVVRKYGHYQVYQRRSFDANALNQWLDQQDVMDISEHDQLLKPGNSQTVWRTGIASRAIVVKRYNLKNWLHVLKRSITRSRASRSWENAFYLRAYHIATPEPLAMIEERWGPFRRRAWLLTEWSDGVSAKRHLRKVGDSPGVRRDMQNLAEIIRCMAKNGIVHGDLKATNFLVGDGQVDLIDLDSMTFPATGWLQRRGVAADQQRFLANWTGTWLLSTFERLLQQSSKRIF